jgi:hypothetical protein
MTAWMLNWLDGITISLYYLYGFISYTPPPPTHSFFSSFLADFFLSAHVLPSTVVLYIVHMNAYIKEGHSKGNPSVNNDCDTFETKLTSFCHESIVIVMPRPLIHGILEKIIMMDVNFTNNYIRVHLIIIGHKNFKTKHPKELVVGYFLFC